MVANVGDGFPHRRLKTLRPWLLIAILAPALAAGCTYFGVKSVSRLIAPKTSYRFEDLPMPKELSLNLRESFIFESHLVRAGILVYKGRANYESVVQFFKDQMPKYGWDLTNSFARAAGPIITFKRAETSLIYEKPGWSCIIVVARGVLETRVEARIGPKEEGEPKAGGKESR